MKSGFRSPFADLRFRTRLALVMFLTSGCMSAVLMYAYVEHNRQIKAYVAGQTSDLLQIIALAKMRVPPTMNRDQAIQTYLKALDDAGLSSVNVVSPTGEVVASTTPGQVGKKVKLKTKHSRTPEKLDPIQISAELRDVDVDPNVEQNPYIVEFPLVQGDKVLGYAQIRGQMDTVGLLMRRMYLTRLVWTLVTMLVGMFAVVYLAFRFTKPVDELAAGAKQVAQGNLYVTLPEIGTGELGRLAQTFNQMVERLRENRELQERLNQAEKLSLLGRFASTVAHEVRNSLNFINLSIDQIRAKHVTSEQRAARELQRNLSNIKDEVSRLNRLVNDFLAAGRQSPPQLATCDLWETVRQAIDVVEKQAQQQNVSIAAELPAEPPPLRADAAQLKTCFLNVMTNAIQAMPRGGQMRVTANILLAHGKANAVELRFADTGTGIPPSDREKIFAPFYSTKPTGFGLGLAITRKIVEDHGGSIRVADSHVPEGTTMVIELPLSTAASDSEAAPAPVQTAQPTHTS
ncbi:MAG TPA: ATP-binding protein [Terriglobia bacterium]|nr:ATP-binding protein [Terriglobia bacterium]